MTIGERIKQRRIELNMSQDELAKKVGYKSRSSINKIELARELPLRKVTLMAKALETTPSYLMGWSDEKYRLAPFDAFAEFEDFDFQSEYADRQSQLKRIMAYASFFDMLEKEKYRDLLTAADGCSDNQLDIAINMLNTFKKGG